MAGSRSDNQDFNIYQDVISQFPLLNGYTHVLRVFEVSHDTARDVLVDTLQAAFDEVKAKIPWLGGQVIAIDGVVQVTPWPHGASPIKVLRKDAGHILPSFAEIMAAGGPNSMFPPEHIVPWPGLPAPHGITKHPVPVAVLSTTFIKGGVLQTLSAHHQLMDGTALFKLWDLLAAIMNGDPDPIPDEVLTEANRDRTAVIPLLRPDELAMDYCHLLRPQGFVLRSPPPTRWCVFSVPLAACQRIKELASDRASTAWDPRVSFISSNDALSAFTWQCISRVRLANGRHPKQVSKFGRAIDLRRGAGVSSSYMGQMIGHASTRLQLGEIATVPLPRLACALRQDLGRATTRWAIQSYASFIAGARKDRLLYGGVYDPYLDVGASSIVQIGQDFKPFLFGVFGESRMLRKPDVVPIPGCMYFMPSDNEHDVQLLLCMTGEDLAGLVADVEWTRYIKCVDVQRAGVPEKYKL